MSSEIYVIQIPEGRVMSGYYLESFARTDIWKKELKDAHEFTSESEAQRVAKKYGGKVITK